MVKGKWGTMLMDCTLTTYQNVVNSAGVKDLVRDYRHGNKAAKEQLHAVLWNGKFCPDLYDNYLEMCKMADVKPKGPRKDVFFKPSGWLMMDYDHVDSPKALLDQILVNIEAAGLLVDEVLGLAHITPSGKGLRIVIRREAGLTAMEEQEKWNKIAGMKCDPSCKNLSRLSFVTEACEILYFDPELLFTPIVDFPEDGVIQIEQDRLESLVAPVEIEIDPLLDTQTEVYDDIPLSMLVKLVERRLGGAPVGEGNRHNFLKKMCCNLRWVMNFDAKMMQKYLPTYGLPTMEVKSLIDYFCENNYYESAPMEMKQAIDESREMMQEIKATAVDEAVMYDPDVPQEIKDLHDVYESATMPQIPEILPRPMQLIADTLPRDSKGCGMMASFATLGLYPKNCKFTHILDIEEEAAFLVLKVGVTSEGKNDNRRIQNFILEPIEEHTRQAEKMIQNWKSEKEAAKKKPSLKAPERPSGIRRQSLPCDMTKAAKRDALEYTAPWRVYVRGAEMEDLYAMNDGKPQDFWRQACDIYDCEEDGQLRASSEAVECRPKLRINWEANVTPSRLIEALVKNHSISQGALSRLTICLITKEDKFGFSERKVIKDIKKDMAAATELRSLINRLENYQDCVIDCEEALQWHWKQVKMHEQYAACFQFDGYTNIVYRAIKSAYLRAMHLYLMNGEVWTKEIEKFAEWSLKYDMWGKLKLFKQDIQKEIEKERNAINGIRTTSTGVQKKKGRFTHLTLLPNTFTQKDVEELRAKLGETVTSGQTYNQINRWVADGKVTRIEKGLYAKN